MVKTALTLKNKYGLCSIPVNGKFPQVEWEPYQDEMPTDELITNWWTNTYRHAGIAVVTGKVSGYVCVVDVDSYKDLAVMAKVKALMPDGLRFPVSTTPRGGEHWWFRSEVQLGDKIGFMKGVDFRSGGIIVAPPSHGYSWKITPKSTKIPMLPESILELLECDSFDFGENKQPKSVDPADKKPKAEEDAKYFSDGRRDNDLFTVANSLIKTGCGQPFTEAACNRIAYSWDEVNPNWIKTKVESAIKRHEARSISEVVREWVVSTHGIFLSTDVHRDLTLSTRVHKKNCSEILRRMVDEGLIERCGTKNGQFRKVEKVLDPMNWKDCDTENYYDLKMPLGLHNDVDIFPGNIVIIAGSPNSGKTSFVLNIAKMNGDKKIVYFNSEMGPEELKKRLLLFDDMGIDDWNVDFYPRTHNFGDVIEPDSLNIVDFLEINDNFFSIGEQIKKVHDKLRKGIAVICLQKKKGAELGRGAEFSLEKPRLYLSMDFQKIKIVKCKNPKYLNVNGKEIPFTLIKGTTFIAGETSEEKS